MIADRWSQTAATAESAITYVALFKSRARFLAPQNDIQEAFFRQLAHAARRDRAPGSRYAPGWRRPDRAVFQPAAFQASGRTTRQGAAHSVQSQAAHAIRTALRGLSRDARSRLGYDLSGRGKMHGMPRHHQKRQSGGRQACRVLESAEACS